jgi:hypothetical protein
MKIWILSWKNDFGLNIKASRNRKELVDFLYSYVCEYWNDVAEDTSSGNKPAPKDPPHDKMRAIKIYFNNHPDYEAFTLKAFDI